MPPKTLMHILTIARFDTGYESVQGIRASNDKVNKLHISVKYCYGYRCCCHYYDRQYINENKLSLKVRFKVIQLLKGLCH